MNAWTIKPLNESVEADLRSRIDPQDLELVKARIKVRWEDGVLFVRHPNFKWILGREATAAALERARLEAEKMLPEYQIDKDYEVQVK